MHKIFIAEVGGQWVVAVESAGRRQEYLCESLEQAQRWQSLLSSPVRHHHHEHEHEHGVRGRSEA